MSIALLLLAALVCFVLAAVNVPIGTINLVAAGLAFWVLSLLLGSLAGIGGTTLLVLLVVIVLIVVLVYVARRPRAAAK